jgi:Zn-dependent membrane protease YugP
MIPLVLAGLVITALAFAPSLWIKHVLQRHGREREDLPGTGAELARHLLKRFELDGPDNGVTVEKTDPGRDHYDPQARVIRLSPSHYDGRSIAAVAVAAHEVGHAIQFGRDETVSRLRKRWIPLAMQLKRAGILLLTLLPVLGLLTRSPAAIGAIVGLSLLLQLAGVLAYMIVLPEEWDASFAKALPVLAEGEYVSDEDLPAVHQVLRAAALTYVATALAEVVNIARWALILRR